MKKVLVWLLITSFLFLYSSEAQAFFFEKKKKAETQQQAPATPQETTPTAKPKAEEAKSPEQPTPKINKAQQDAWLAKRALAEKKRNELNNSEWQIELGLIGSKEKKLTDSIIFKNNQITCVGFNKSGFPTTNYTITVQKDGLIVWETMQTSEKAGVTFWRGEIDPSMQKMNGVLTHKIDDSTIQEYYFVSTAKKNLSASVGKNEK